VGLGIALAIAVSSLAVAVMTPLFIFGRRFRNRLRRHPAFTPSAQATWNGSIDYAEPDHPLLTELRDMYDLEAIAGTGAEIDRFVRLMSWVHGLTTHARNPSWPKRFDGLHLVELAREQGKRFNCWMYAIVLNDVLLSMGFASRVIHLWPYVESPNESHVVVSVFSREYETWIHLDPDMCAYVTDEDGTPLGIMEIRDRIVRRAPLRVSNTIHMAYASLLGKRLLKRLYIWYLSKNILRIDCPVRSGPPDEPQVPGKAYLHLIPDGYHDEWLDEPRVTERGSTIHYLRDPDLFWQPPSP